MSCDWEKEDNVYPNLDVQSRPSTFHPSVDINKHAFGNTSYMTSPSEFNLLSDQTKVSLVSEEPSLVDGASCSKLNSSRTSSVNLRPHQVDAVHPFFNGYRSVKFDKSTSTDNQVFYCRQCKRSLELSQEAVNQHFEAIQHTPIEENCVYCNTAVYEYFYNENICYYHRCPIDDQKNVVVSTTENSSDRISSNKGPIGPVESVSRKPTEKSCCKPF